MDARGPLSPRASAFSIASLVAAEAAERTTHLAPGSSEPVKPLGSPAGMHFSTVTRDMEGEPPHCVWADVRQTPAPGAQAKRAGGIGGGRKGSTGGVSAWLPAWTLGRRGRAAPCPNPVPPSPGDPAAETGAVEPRAEEGVGQERGTRGSRQRGTESSEKWGDRRRAPESRETRRNSERKQEGTAGGKELEKRRGKEDTRAGKDRKETRRARTTEKRREVKKVES
ncbi:hypothetical protein MG293_013944 [Ovis ammon polii]|uniref:Uncharacterized protein n=1 Tax=Ovis ammon polii TaxID=230172 RepID=A0AAD4TYJ1_OVIAM|nr:hypothetical protein MG293_013944 [Ovis ammon polii]